MTDLLKDIVVPLASALLGGLFGILAGLIVASRSEILRRLARWEPYANALWSYRLDLAAEVADRTADVLSACWKGASTPPGSDENKAYGRKMLKAAQPFSKNGKLVVFLSPRVEQLISDFFVEAMRAFQSSRLENELPENYFESLYNRQIKILKQLQNELHIAPLAQAQMRCLELAAKQNALEKLVESNREVQQVNQGDGE